MRARAAEAALRRSNEELQWFAYRVAHDLNEPLRTVTAHVQLLERKLQPLPENSAAPMRFVVGAAARMRTFIDDLLHYAELTNATGAIQQH